MNVKLLSFADDGLGSSDCPSFRATEATKSDRFAAIGIYMGVCCHDHADTETGRIMMSAGEGLEYAHYIVRKRLHLANVLALTDVFGAVPLALGPKLSFFMTDVPCKLIPYLERVDPEVVRFVRCCLGKVHG